MTDKAKINDVEDYGSFIIPGNGSLRHFGSYVVADRMVHVTVWASGGWRTKASQVGATPAKVIAHMIAGELLRRDSIDLDDLAKTLAELDHA